MLFIHSSMDERFFRRFPCLDYCVQIMFFKKTNNPVSGQTPEVRVLVHTGGCWRGEEKKPAQTEAVSVGLGWQHWRSEAPPASLTEFLLNSETASETKVFCTFLISPVAPFCHSEYLPGLSPKWPPQVLITSLVLQFVGDLVTKLHRFWMAAPTPLFPLLFSCAVLQDPGFLRKAYSRNTFTSTPKNKEDILCLLP